MKKLQQRKILTIFILKYFTPYVWTAVRLSPVYPIEPPLICGMIEDSCKSGLWSRYLQRPEITKEAHHVAMLTSIIES
jgi:hypothetical protein